MVYNLHNTKMKPIKIKMRAVPAFMFNLAGIVLAMGIMKTIQFGLSVYPYADTHLSFSDNVKKLSLVQQAMAMPDTLQDWDQKDLEILLRQPQVKRDEKIVQSWHYHGESCALDIYFDGKKTNPDYVEFRPLSMNHDIQVQYESADAGTMKLYCLKDVLEAQGVDTPSSYARQPLPSWESPYKKLGA